MNYDAKPPSDGSTFAQLDARAEQYHAALAFNLKQYDCSAEARAQNNFYSPLRSCADCSTAYRDWLCAVHFPKCELSTDEIIRPCDWYCHRVVQSCPGWLGLDCPTAETLDADYTATSVPDQHAGCNVLNVDPYALTVF